MGVPDMNISKVVEEKRRVETDVMWEYKEPPYHCQKLGIAFVLLYS